MSIAYRLIERSDIPGLARIRAAEWGSEDYWITRITGYLDGVVNPQKALAPRVIYIAEQAGVIIGFIAGHLTQRYNCDGELEWINVAPESRGSAVASKLFRLLAAWFVEQKAARICTNCAPDNAPALRFYTKHGAKPLNEHFLVWDDIGVSSRNNMKA